MTSKYNNESGYFPGHPWYYVLGGVVLSPKEILREVQARGYRGCKADDITATDGKPEPQRSERLRKLRAEALRDLKSDMSCYRECARKLSVYRKGIDGCHPVHNNIHTSIGLKHNHMFNDFAHLTVLDDLLLAQPDLFGF